MGLLEISNKEYHDDGFFHGSYQFTRLEDIINQFMVVYVGEDKIIPKAKKTDVAFHAQRAMQELSFDTFKSLKAEEITVPPSLTMTLPIDYVNYTKISWIDTAGTKHLLYPELKSSNPRNFYQNEEGDYSLDPVAKLINGSNIYELDGDYSDILVHGMRVTGLHIPSPPAAVIHEVTTTAGITSITLKSINGLTNINATATTAVKIRIFRYVGLGSRRLLGNSSAVHTTVSVGATAGDTSFGVTSKEGIKEGMYVNHPSVINDNNVRDQNDRLTSIKVIGVGTHGSAHTVELSHPITYNITAGVGGVSFVSYEGESDTWDNFKSASPPEDRDDYHDDIIWASRGGRYGLDPQNANINGSFYVDDNLGEIHFSSNLSGKTIVVDYLSDSLANDGDHRVHKFAEEAMYKCIVYAMISTRANIQEYIVRRYKKERFAAIRTAKLRLSNIKLEEITQVLRGKSKQIKH